MIWLAYTAYEREIRAKPKGNVNLEERSHGLKHTLLRASKDKLASLLGFNSAFIWSINILLSRALFQNSAQIQNVSMEGYSAQNVAHLWSEKMVKDKDETRNFVPATIFWNPEVRLQIIQPPEHMKIHEVPSTPNASCSPPSPLT
jgi:hypothetical protein